MRPGRGERFSRSSQAAAAMAMSMSGTLTRNAECQLNASSSAPPTTGPTAAPSAAVAPQMLSASVRSRGSAKTERMSDRVEGITIAPPMPSRARIAMTAAALSAHRTATEPTANSGVAGDAASACGPTGHPAR